MSRAFTIALDQHCHVLAANAEQQQGTTGNCFGLSKNKIFCKPKGKREKKGVRIVKYLRVDLVCITGKLIVKESHGQLAHRRKPCGQYPSSQLC